MRKPPMGRDDERMGECGSGGLAAMSAFDELYNHWLNVVMASRWMSDPVRLTAGGDVARTMLEYGRRLDLASRESNGYRRLKLAEEASALFDMVRFSVNKMLLTPYLGRSRSRPAWNQKANPLARYREHTTRLVERAGRIFGGWLRWCRANQGAR